jgi:signal transduction histidine kinase/tetratricopeptide (TPR) repeat protein
MEILATNNQVVQWENELPAIQGSDHARMLVRLAWHMRQRDTSKALSMAEQAEREIVQFDEIALPFSERKLLLARLLLIKGEAKWLFSELDEAQSIAEAALQLFQQVAGKEALQGIADAHHLLAWIASYRGDLATLRNEYTIASLHAKQCNDRARQLLSDSYLGIQTAFNNLPLALTQWEPQFIVNADSDSPMLAACANDFLACTTSLSSEFGKSAAHGIRAHHAALETGQIHRAISVASNVGDAFSSLNDYQAALHWMQISLDLARASDWPASISMSLTQTAETLRRLGRLDAAKSMLEDAIPILSSVFGSRAHLMALRYLGDLSIDRKEFTSALDFFSSLQEHADQKQFSDYMIGARRGRAHALSLLNKPEAALLIAKEALELARQNKDLYREIDVLRVLASIHLRHRLTAQENTIDTKAAVDYLRQAINVANNIVDYQLPSELLLDASEAQAALGYFEEAYALSKLALEAREKKYNQVIDNRATAMQINHQTERMRAEGQHLRALAEAEAQRAEVLQQTSDVLERLGSIGQEITGSLNAENVFEALNRHVHGLLHVTAFVIYLMDPGEQSMTSAFGVENGQPIESDVVSMSNAVSNSARCVKERRELAIQVTQDEEVPGLIPGTERVLSMLFAPLIIADKVLGVMTIQSSHVNAYGERERMIFRSLCAYGAIALSNADAYLRLKETQAHLVAQEKLAALGSLVAGVAHELNTPIGNCLLVASTLQDGTKNILNKLNQQNLRRSELATYFEEAKTSSEIMMRGLSSAANLVSSFKQVAVDRTSEQRRTFDLRQVLTDIIATLNIRVNKAGHTIVLDAPISVSMDSYPGVLGQVITNLIENAILHAFEKAQRGTMTITVSQSDLQRVLIRFADNGIGIHENNLKRVFDPFFTTKLGQGGSGLGLNISYNIITSIMHGQITVKSMMGVGTTFSLDLPLIV